MYLRFVRLRVHEGSEASFQSFFRERVVPALAEVAGCRFAGLLVPFRSDEHRSLNLWSSEPDAHDYERSPLHDRLLREAFPMLSERNAWRPRRVELATGAIDSLPTIDLPLDVMPTLELADALAALAGEPGVERVERELPADGFEIGGEILPALAALARPVFLRMVSVRVAPGRRAEFDGVHREQVEPALAAAAGCIACGLAHGARDPNDTLSISIWDREESAARQELAGELDRQLQRLASTFSLGAQRAPSAGVEIATFHLIHARAFPGHDGGG
jgi:heme-degrading monooxygenase HmoA